MLKVTRYAIIFLVVIIVLAVVFVYIEHRINPKEIALKIRDMGPLGALVIITLTALEVVIAPIPGAAVAIASGYAFGTFYGTVFAYTGNLAGTAIAFLLARKFGRPFVERLIHKNRLHKYDLFFQKKGKLLLLVFIFPFFPTDILAFGLGLSTIKFRLFMPVVAIAYLPNMLLLNYFGDKLFELGFTNRTIFIAVLMSFAFLLSLLIYMKLNEEKKP